MTSDIDERVMDEVEALNAILMDEVAVKTNESGCPISVETTVVPSTADNVLEQYVCVTLEVELPRGYPDVIPLVKLRNPRGLDDSIVSKIEREARDKCEAYRGQPVIYELIELVRENLTASNLPSCQCAICLYGFREGDHFTKTECYHYFHSHCLACHVTSTERIFREEQEKLPAWQRDKNAHKVVCPVCREAISCDMKLLGSACPPLDVEAAQLFEPSPELRALQRKMAAMYLHQKKQGGIIDPEANDSKLLLVTVSTPEPGPPCPRPLPPPPPLQQPGPSPRLDEPPRRGRGGYRGRPRYHKSSRGSRHYQAASNR